MITKEQLIEQFGIKAGLTQDQFDRIINELRISEQLEKAPVYDALAAAELQSSNLKLRKMQLNLEIQQVSAEIGRLQQQNRVIGHAYYEAKKELINLNPKQ